MVWHTWLFWRLAWGLNWGGFGKARCEDGHGTWVGFGYLYILTTSRVQYPLGESTLYRQVYHHMKNGGHHHGICVDTAVEAVEIYGKHRAMSMETLTHIVEECRP